MRHGRSCILAVAALLFESASPVHAQGPRIAPADGAIDAVFARYDSETTPGCSVAVIDGGTVTFKKSYGMADPALGVPMTSSTTFWIPYSEARIFVALAVAMLEKEGRITLDDPIRRHVPQVPAYAADVTIRQLLHHTSGLADYGTLSGPGFDIFDRLSEDELFRLLSRWDSLGFVPGQGVMYSNTDYALLNILVARVTGGSLHDYLAVRLLEPEGMTATRIGFDQAIVVPGHALFHEPDGEGFRRLLRYRVSPVGKIAVTTSLDDIVRLDRALRDPGTGLAALLDHLEQGAPTQEPGNDEGYAFGVYRSSNGGLPLVEYRGVGGFTYLVQVPDSDLSVATFCNAYDGMWSFGPEVARLHFAPPAVATPESGTEPLSSAAYSAPLAELQSYVGEYRDPRGGTVVDVALVDDALIMGLRGGTPFPALKPVGAGKFETSLEGDRFVVEFEVVDGDMVVTTWDPVAEEPGGPPLRRFVPWEPDAASLPAYAGVYVGDRMEATLHVRTDGERLWLAASGMVETELSPMNEVDMFRLPDVYRFRFQRDVGGRVIAVVLESTRVQGMRFTRID